ncbi:phage antitermination protein [Gluconacetobacter aggeris]|uniref:Phage antitermination protein n=1 Tax=Gluconacetobacter aggeris TaxID=1286186 RepID=A0A7W4NUY8_9PROT|nr:phage antirepressor KilAC domain-containing protein [Gluconacetobacter aggeris]MBB2167261.1 phage antitermination protein [Gluconacetobacter aggeris]
MSALVLPFAFEGHEVRIVTRDGTPWWVATDVCTVLDIVNPTRAMDRLDADDRALHIMKGADGRPRETSIINESGLWSLVLTSRKAAAKRFKKWLTSEVIPSIRRTGAYVVAAPGESQTDLVARALSAAEEAIRRQGVAIDTLAPKAAAYDRLARSTDQVSLTEAAKTLGWPSRRFISALHAQRWIYRRQPNGVWLGHADKERAGYLAHRTTDIPDRDGRLVARPQVLLTAKGLARLATLLPEWGAATC